MTDREAQIEALWTYEISTKRVLRRAVKKGFITQAETNEFPEKRLSSWIRRKSLAPPLPLGEKMRAKQIDVNLHGSMTEIAKEKKSSSPGYLIQSWMRSGATIEYLQMWERIYKPRFQEVACNEPIHTVKTTGIMLTPSL